MSSARDELISLEESKRRLAKRLGVCRETLRRAGLVTELRKAGRHLHAQTALDGSVHLRVLRIRVSAVEALAERVIGGLPASV